MADQVPTTNQYAVVKAMAAHLIEHERRDTIQAAVMLVSIRFGAKAGEWLLREMTLCH